MSVSCSGSSSGGGGGLRPRVLVREATETEVIAPKDKDKDERYAETAHGLRSAGQAGRRSPTNTTAAATRPALCAVDTLLPPQQRQRQRPAGVGVGGTARSDSESPDRQRASLRAARSRCATNTGRHNLENSAGARITPEPSRTTD